MGRREAAPYDARNWEAVKSAIALTTETPRRKEGPFFFNSLRLGVSVVRSLSDNSFRVSGMFRRVKISSGISSNWYNFFRTIF
jgi:hypothetical protein